MISADQGTEVDLDEVAGGQHRIGGPVMRDRRIRPAGHDRLERDAVGAVVEHQGLQFAAHLAFGPSGPQSAARHQVGQRGVGRLARQPQQRHLAGVLDLAKRLDRLRGTDQLGGPELVYFSSQRVEPVHGHHMALEAQLAARRPTAARPAR